MKLRIILFSLVCTFVAYAQQQPFRFAWLTDTHVGSPTGEEDLRRAVRDINTLAACSFVIVSGDITEMGSTVELRLAKRILDSLHIPCHVIPGNHDTKWSESGCTMLSRLWKDDKFTFEFRGVRFIACSSGPNMRMGDGHVPEEDMRWLDSVITRIPDKRRPVIFINHYPLDDGLDNWYDVLAEIKRVNTVAALCGHGHAEKVYSFEGVPGVMARSNLRADKPAGGYTIVDVRKDSLLFTERMLHTDMPTSERQWHGIANSRHAYAADTQHYPRPEYAVNARYPSVHVQWQIRTSSTIGCTPAVSGSTIVTGNSRGSIEAYSLRNGKKLWSYRTGGSVYSSPAIGVLKTEPLSVPLDGPLHAPASPAVDSIVCVVAGSSDGSITCLDIRHGNRIWSYRGNGPVVASPLIARGMVYCGSSDGVFRALSLSTGALVWEYPLVTGFVECTPLLYDGKIIFGAWDTFLYALDSQTGVLAWKWTNGSPVRNLSPAACTPVGAQGKIFIVAPDRVMTAIDAATGTTVWRSNAHKVRESIGLSEDAAEVYVRAMNDSLFAVSTSPRVPRTVWGLDCGYGYDIDPSMPVACNGSIFFGTKNGLVYCIDARTRTITGCRKIGNAVINTVRPLSSTRVIASSMDGTIALITFTRP